MTVLTAQAPLGPHHIDKPKGGGIVTRKIQNHCCFRLPGQDYQETRSLLEPTTDSLANLAPMRVQTQAPLQCGIGNANDANYQAAASARLSSDPGVSIDMRPVDALSSRMVELPDRVFKFPGVWPKVTKIYQPAPAKLLGTLVLNEPGHPATFKYSLDVPDGMRIEFPPGENRARIFDSEGVERLKILSPQGWDSSTVNPESMDGRKPVRVTMKEAGTVRVGGRTCVVVELEPNRDDLAGATYPVDIEQNPTVEITGLANIQDTMIYKALPNNNYGSAPGISMKTDATTLKGLVRIVAGIPEGAITGFRMHMYSSTTAAGTISAYFVSDANTWGEGFANGTPYVTGACWNKAKYNYQDWAGYPILGCSKSVDDYDADPSPPQFVGGALGWQEFILDPAWPPLWRDLIRVANGMVMESDLSNAITWRSTEHANALHFELDHEPVGGAAQRFLMMGSG